MSFGVFAAVLGLARAQGTGTTTTAGTGGTPSAAATQAAPETPAAPAIDPEGSLVDSLGKTWNLGDEPEPVIKVGEKWSLAKYKDLLTGEPASTLLLPADDKISGAGGRVVPTLLVHCFDDQPSIMFHVRFPPEIELIDLGFTYSTTYVELGTGKPKRVLMQRSKDSQYLILEKPTKWFEALMAADTLRVRYTPFNSSPQVMKFDIATFDEVVPQHLTCFADG